MKSNGADIHHTTKSAKKQPNMAGQGHFLPTESFKNPDIFRHALLKAISNSLEPSPLVVSKSIDSMKGQKNIRLSTCYYNETIIDKIKTELEDMYNVNITFSNCRGRKSPNYYNYRCIQWGCK